MTLKRCVAHSVLLLPSLARAASECFKPNGVGVADGVYKPCQNLETGELSNICCATGREAPPGSDDGNGTLITADECLANGICRNRYKSSHGDEVTRYLRGFCSFSDWSSGKCLDICTGQAKDDILYVTPCDKTNANSSGRWCCGESDDCCVPERNVPVYTLAAPFNGMNSTSSAISSLTSSTSIPTMTPGSSSNARENNGGLSPGAKAGIGVAAAVGGLLLLGMGIWLGMRLRGRNSDTPKYGESNHATYSYHNYTGGADGNYAHSAPGQQLAEELSGDREISEMPGKTEKAS